MTSKIQVPEHIAKELEAEQTPLKEETKIPDLDTKSITVTEVRMSPDLKTAKIFVIPLGGKNSAQVIDKLKEFSFIIRKVLTKKIMVKFMPKLFFHVLILFPLIIYSYHISHA